MITLIILAEVAFWVAIIAGLFARYIIKMPKLSLFFFFMTPLIDLALLLLTAIDLKNGEVATFMHGIAAIYIGISIAYGKTMIDLADEKFRVWVLKMKEVRKPLTGTAKGKREIKLFGKHVLAFVLGSILLRLMVTFVDDSDSTAALQQVWKIWSIVLLADGVISFSYVLFPKKLSN